VEVTWNPVDNRWDAVRPAGRNYNCDIDARNLPTREQWGRIDGQEDEEPSTSEPRTPAPSETSQEGDQSESEDESEVAEIAQAAESLHIAEPETIHIRSPEVEMATATITHTEEMIAEEVRRIAEEAEAHLRPIDKAGHESGSLTGTHELTRGNTHHEPDPWIQIHS